MGRKRQQHFPFFADYLALLTSTLEILVFVEVKTRISINKKYNANTLRIPPTLWGNK